MHANGKARPFMSTNIQWQSFKLTESDRAKIKHQQPLCLWMTGLSGAGKSTLANALEEKLNSLGKHTYILDGDNVRTGLNSDLDFSAESREENIRRIGHVSNLMKDAGLVVLSAFVSPYRKDREFVRRTVGEEAFTEVFISTPLEICEQRDVKGLYVKARRGEIKNFTGISAPFEQPNYPDLDIPTQLFTVEAAAKRVVDHILLKITNQ